MKGQRENEFLIRSVVFTETGHSKLIHWDNQRDGMGRERGSRFKREGIYVYLWLIHEKRWAGGSTSWNQDFWEKYQ